MTDEGSSHYIQHNLKRCRNPALCRKLQEEKDEDFRVNCLIMQKGFFAYVRILQAQTNNKGFLFVLFVALRPRLTATVMSKRSFDLATLFLAGLDLLNG